MKAWKEFHGQSFPLTDLLAMIRRNELEIPRH
jgi:hypothetical protein